MPQGNRIWNLRWTSGDTYVKWLRVRFLVGGCDLSNQETLEQFSACWEGLEDPRSGNAGLHDFHELLVIALCAVLCGVSSLI